MSLNIGIDAVSASDKAYIIPVLRSCNATCRFCSMVTYAPETAKKLMDVFELKEIIPALCKEGVRRFEITGGGEPTLHPNLAGIVEAIYESAPEAHVKMYTNGSRPHAVPLVDEVNVSRVCIDPIANNSVMRFAGDSPELGEVSLSLRTKGIKRLRLSVPLIRGYVDSPAAVVDLLKVVDGWFDAVVLRPLYPATPHDFVDMGVDCSEWIGEVLEAIGEIGVDLTVEFDDGAQCERDNFILGPDCRVYADWPMQQRVSRFASVGDLAVAD